MEEGEEVKVDGLRERSVDRVEWTLSEEDQGNNFVQTITVPRQTNLNQLCLFNQQPGTGYQTERAANSENSLESPCLPHTPSLSTSAHQRDSKETISGSCAPTCVEEKFDEGDNENSNDKFHCDSLEMKSGFDNSSPDGATMGIESGLPQIDRAEETLVESPQVLQNQEISRKILYSKGKGFGAVIPFKPSVMLEKFPRRGSRRKGRERSEMFVHLDDTDGGATTEDDESEVSELSIVWGKTVDTDDESISSSHSVPYRSELHFTPVKVHEDRSKSNDSERHHGLPSTSTLFQPPSSETHFPEDHHPKHSEICIPIRSHGFDQPEHRYATIWTGQEVEEEGGGAVENVTCDVCGDEETSNETVHVGHNIQFVAEIQTVLSRTLDIDVSLDKGKDTSTNPSRSPPSNNSATNARKSLYKLPESILNLGMDTKPSSDGNDETLDTAGEKMYHSEINLSLPSFKGGDNRDDNAHDSAVGADTSESKEMNSPPDESTSESGIVLAFDANDRSSVERSEEIVSEPKAHIHIPIKRQSGVMDITKRVESPSVLHDVCSRGKESPLEDIEASDDSQFRPVKPRKKKKGRKKKKKQIQDEEARVLSDDPGHIPAVPLCVLGDREKSTRKYHPFPTMTRNDSNSKQNPESEYLECNPPSTDSLMSVVNVVEEEDVTCDDGRDEIVREYDPTKSITDTLTDEHESEEPRKDIPDEDKISDKLNESAGMPDLPSSILEVEVEDGDVLESDPYGEQRGIRQLNPSTEPVISLNDPGDNQTDVSYFDNPGEKPPQSVITDSSISQLPAQACTERSEEFVEGKKKEYIVTPTGLYGRPIIKPTKRMSTRMKRERNRTNSNGDRQDAFESGAEKFQPLAGDCAKRGHKRKFGSHSTYLLFPDDDNPFALVSDEDDVEPSHPVSVGDEIVPSANVLGVTTDELEFQEHRDGPIHPEIDSGDEFPLTTDKRNMDQGKEITDVAIVQTDNVDSRLEFGEAIGTVEILNDDTMAEVEFIGFSQTVDTVEETNDTVLGEDVENPFPGQDEAAEEMTINKPTVITGQTNNVMAERENLVGIDGRDNDNNSIAGVDNPDRTVGDFSDEVGKRAGTADKAESEANNSSGVSTDYRNNQLSIATVKSQLPQILDDNGNEYLPIGNILEYKNQDFAKANSDVAPEKQKSPEGTIVDSSSDILGNSEKAIDRPEYKLKFDPPTLIHKRADDMSKIDSNTFSDKLDLEYCDDIILPGNDVPSPGENITLPEEYNVDDDPWTPDDFPASVTGWDGYGNNSWPCKNTSIPKIDHVDENASHENDIYDGQDKIIPQISITRPDEDNHFTLPSARDVDKPLDYETSDYQVKFDPVDDLGDQEGSEDNDPETGIDEEYDWLEFYTNPNIPVNVDGGEEIVSSELNISSDPCDLNVNSQSGDDRDETTYPERKPTDDKDCRLFIGQEIIRSERHESVPKPSVIVCRRFDDDSIIRPHNADHEIVSESIDIQRPPRISQCITDEDVDIGSLDFSVNVYDTHPYEDPFDTCRPLRETENEIENKDVPSGERVLDMVVDDTGDTENNLRPFCDPAIKNPNARHDVIVSNDDKAFVPSEEGDVSFMADPEIDVFQPEEIAGIRDGEDGRISRVDTDGNVDATISEHGHDLSDDNDDIVETYSDSDILDVLPGNVSYDPILSKTKSDPDDHASIQDEDEANENVCDEELPETDPDILKESSKAIEPVEKDLETPTDTGISIDIGNESEIERYERTIAALPPKCIRSTPSNANFQRPSDGSGGLRYFTESTSPELQVPESKEIGHISSHDSLESHKAQSEDVDSVNNPLGPFIYIDNVDDFPNKATLEDERENDDDGNKQWPLPLTPLVVPNDSSSYTDETLKTEDTDKERSSSQTDSIDNENADILKVTPGIIDDLRENTQTDTQFKEWEPNYELEEGDQDPGAKFNVISQDKGENEEKNTGEKFPTPDTPTTIASDTDIQTRDFPQDGSYECESGDKGKVQGQEDIGDENDIGPDTLDERRNRETDYCVDVKDQSHDITSLSDVLGPTLLSCTGDTRVAKESAGDIPSEAKAAKKKGKKKKKDNRNKKDGVDNKEMNVKVVSPHKGQGEKKDPEEEIPEQDPPATKSSEADRAQIDNLPKEKYYVHESGNFEKVPDEQDIDGKEEDIRPDTLNERRQRETDYEVGLKDQPSATTSISDAGVGLPSIWSSAGDILVNKDDETRTIPELNVNRYDVDEENIRSRSPDNAQNGKEPMSLAAVPDEGDIPTDMKAGKMKGRTKQRDKRKKKEGVGSQEFEANFNVVTPDNGEGQMKETEEQTPTQDPFASISSETDVAKDLPQDDTYEHESGDIQKPLDEQDIGEEEEGIRPDTLNERRQRETDYGVGLKDQPSATTSISNVGVPAILPSGCDILVNKDDETRTIPELNVNRHDVDEENIRPRSPGDAQEGKEQMILSTVSDEGDIPTDTKAGKKNGKKKKRDKSKKKEGVGSQGFEASANVVTPDKGEGKILVKKDAETRTIPELNFDTNDVGEENVRPRSPGDAQEGKEPMSLAAVPDEGEIPTDTKAGKKKGKTNKRDKRKNKDGVGSQGFEANANVVTPDKGEGQMKETEEQTPTQDPSASISSETDVAKDLPQDDTYERESGDIQKPLDEKDIDEEEEGIGPDILNERKQRETDYGVGLKDQPHAITSLSDVEVPAITPSEGGILVQKDDETRTIPELNFDTYDVGEENVRPRSPGDAQEGKEPMSLAAVPDEGEIPTDTKAGKKKVKTKKRDKRKKKEGVGSQEFEGDFNVVTPEKGECQMKETEEQTPTQDPSASISSETDVTKDFPQDDTYGHESGVIQKPLDEQDIGEEEDIVPDTLNERKQRETDYGVGLKDQPHAITSLSDLEIPAIGPFTGGTVVTKDDDIRAIPEQNVDTYDDVEVIRPGKPEDAKVDTEDGSLKKEQPIVSLVGSDNDTPDRRISQGDDAFGEIDTDLETYNNADSDSMREGQENSKRNETESQITTKDQLDTIASLENVLESPIDLPHAGNVTYTKEASEEQDIPGQEPGTENIDLFDVSDETAEKDGEKVGIEPMDWAAECMGGVTQPNEGDIQADTKTDKKKGKRKKRDKRKKKNLSDDSTHVAVSTSHDNLNDVAEVVSKVNDDNDINDNQIEADIPSKHSVLSPSVDDTRNRTVFIKQDDQISLGAASDKEETPSDTLASGIPSIINSPEQNASDIEYSNKQSDSNSNDSEQGQQDSTKNLVDVLDTNMYSDNRHQIHSQQCVDRQEVYMDCKPAATIRVSKQLLDEVISNKARAEDVLAKNPEAARGDFLKDTPTSITADGEPSLTQAGHLMSEMNLLEDAAMEQRDSLKLAVSEQEKYETEIRQLNTAISEAQQKLLASPVMATSVGALKQQIAEHNTLAAQIKQYQEKVKAVNEKSRELAMNSAQLSPSLFRKHYLPESAYSDLFSAASHQQRANSPLPSSSPLFFDTMTSFANPSPMVVESEIMPSREIRAFSSPTTRLSPSYTPKGATLASKVISKNDSPSQSPRAADSMSLSASQSFDTPRMPLASDSLESAYHTGMSITKTETPPSSARSYDTSTPLSSARSYETPPLSARTTDSALSTPRSYDTVLQLIKPDQPICSNSPSVESMVEKLSRMPRGKSQPPPGGRPTELLRMQDSPETLSIVTKSTDDEPQGRSSPRYVSRMSELSPRTSAISPTTYASARLQALSGSHKSVSDSNLANATSASSTDSRPDTPRMSAAAATSTPRITKVIAGAKSSFDTPDSGSNNYSITVSKRNEQDPWSLLSPQQRQDKDSDSGSETLEASGASLTGSFLENTVFPTQESSTRLASPRSLSGGPSSKPLSSSYQNLVTTQNRSISFAPFLSSAASLSLTSDAKYESPFSRSESLTTNSRRERPEQTNPASRAESLPHKTFPRTKQLDRSFFSLSETGDGKFEISINAPRHSISTQSSRLSENPTARPRVPLPSSSPWPISTSLSRFGDGDGISSSTSGLTDASSKTVVSPPTDVGPRERSSSFGTDVRPVGRPLAQVQADDKVKELNVSFNTLQEQVLTKERELQAALLRQERYQQTVQELTAKMERAYMKLNETPASIAAPLEVQMAEYKETVAEIEGIREDIDKVKERGQLIVDSPDSDGHKAMEATLNMLADRFNNLQALADDKGRQLQEALKDREKHDIAMKAYLNRVGDLKLWLEEVKVRQANTGMLSEDPGSLQTQLDENKEMQEQVNNKLQQLSDLALQCDALCEKEPPAKAERLRNDLASLQTQLGQFKMATIEKQAKYRASIKEAEKRKREMEELDSSVQRLQKWMTDTKEMTRPSEQLATMSAPPIHKELATDLKQHKQLVRQLSKRGLKDKATKSVVKPLTDKEIQDSWKRLDKHLLQKTKSLEDLLRTKTPGELVKVSLYAPARYADSSRQLQEVKGVLNDMGDCWGQLQVQLEEKQIELDEAFTFQQQYQSALENVSGYLDLCQQQVFTAPSTTEDHIRQNENIRKEIQSLQQEVSSINEQAEDLMSSTGGANQPLIQSCLTSLNNRIKLLDETAEAQAEDLRKASREWKQYQAEVVELQQRLQDTQKLVLAPSSTQSIDQLMTNNQNIEAQLKKCESQLKDLKGKEATLTKCYPKGVFPSELVTLQSNFMELQRRAQEKKASLQKSVSVQDRYVKLLKDYANFVDTAQDKLKNDSISARDLNHLKQQLSAHKDFFSDLEVHKAILDSLASQCDEATRKKHHAQHSSLSSLSHVLVDQASLHGQRLERLTRQWIELDEKHIQLQKTLSNIEAQVPTPIASGDSLTTIQDKLNKYKRLQSELSDERGAVFEVVDRGKQILHSVNCPTLETAITDLADKWVSLNTDLTHELKRTETLGEQLSAFEAEAALFTSWLRTAKMTCASFKQLTPSDVQNIGSIRNKVEKVLEFRKEVENQLPLKNRLLKVGNELLQNKNYDTRGLSDRLRSYENEWAQLEKGIGETEEFLHQAQMDLMPSRQALAELTSWIEEINKALKSDAKKRINSVADIELMVKKYKGYKIELSSKHMTLDFVNQAVLAPGPGETDVSHEKLDFADKLGELNKKWKKVVAAVDDRLNTLEGLQGKWEEYEQTHLRLQAWIREQEDKITRYKLIGHEVGVKQTLRDCKTMQQQLQTKQAELATVKTLGNNLISSSKESPGCQQSVRDSMSSLDQNWKRLEEQTRQLENLLTDMLDQWARYHTDLASLTQVLTQTEYCLQQYTLVGGDISTLRSQVAKLKDLEMKLNKQSQHLDSFVTLASQLQQVCEPPVQADIRKTVDDIQTRWGQLSADLSTRCRLFDQSLSQWDKYEALYNKILEWLNNKEKLCTELITMRDDPSLRKESLAKSRELQGQLDNLQSQLSDLNKLSDQLTKNMNPSTIAILTTRQSAIDQRLLALRQILSQHMATLKEDLSQMGLFNEAFEVVNNFLKYAETVLASVDPTKADEQEHIQLRLDQLKRLLSQFTSNVTNLDHVNNLGYILALNQIDATRLRELNHKWQDLLEDTRERSRTLQTNLLIQQDFTTKCEAWMAFLAQTEQDLAIEIKADLPSLKEQLKKCEQFESEIYSHQQILHAIISDGQKMMKAGEVEDKDEFEQKLKLLAEQWQSVLRRANQRKTIIESVISQWDEFNSMSHQLMRWLKEKEAAMKAFEFDSTSLQSVRSLVDKVKTTEREFALQEASFKKSHDLGNSLLQRADSASADDIRNTLDQLQKSWFHVFSQLDEHRSRLEGVDRQWLECEDDIDDILNWLKDIRLFLHSDLPSSYDDLQADINRCKDIASSFVSSEDRRQRLLSKEKQLSRIIQADDLNLLHQRIRLLNKQWEELRHQTLIREQQLSDALYRWNNFGDRLRSLLSWISEMEVKVVSNKDMHVEDLLIKLETVYKEEMREKEIEKNILISQGQTLMKISSEIRASDMEQKLLRLEEKWAHLKAVMDFRHRKLQETVLAVKQLDTSMKNLTLWLSTVESELSSTIAYKDSGVREIHGKLHDTQELQRDIERHSPGVSAVLNLCEVLLHDSDACPTETEFSALQHAMKSLEKRWRNICALCPERRSRVEETWQLWERFREDCCKFSDWLTITEKNVKDSETDISNIAAAKEEILKYENLQRNVHDHLKDLEHINKQYRHLAKEGRTDTDGSLKVMMTDLNNRWDSLQLRVTEIMKKLRHSASIRQDFEATYTSLMTWLTEVDMQLTNLDSLDGLDLETKISEIQRIEDEIQTKRHRMAYLDQAAVYLIQKGDSQDALRVQHQLDDFRTFSKAVFERVNTLKIKTDRMLVAQVENFDSPDMAVDRYFPSAEDRLREMRDAQDSASLARQTAELEAYLEISPPESPPNKRRLDASPSRITLPTSQRTRSPVRRAGAHIPRSTSPSPLRSSSPIRRSFSPSKRGSPSPSRMAIDTTDGQPSSVSSPRFDIAQREKSAKLDILMEQLVESLDDANIKLARMEKALNSHDPDMERSLRMLVDCENAVDTVCRLDRLLKTETGLPIIASVDHQVKSVLDRWEQLRSRAKDEDLRISQDRHDLNQFNNDLDDMLDWLTEAEALQDSHQNLPADIIQLEIIVRQYKDFLEHLEAKKATVLSINLLSRNYLASKQKDTHALSSKLHEMNRRWDQVVARAGDIQRDLQLALIQCQEYHRSIDDYQLWLENIEAQVRQSEPLNLNAGDAALWAKYTKLMELHQDLQRNHPKVQDLKETADQLLLSTDSPEMATARDKTHIISNRLRSLLHLTTAYVSSLENKLKVKPKRGSASSSFDISEGRSSGLGSSYASRSSTPLKPRPPSLRSRMRSPFAISRQFDYLS